jgi:RNA polymerase sigma-70 factor (ECF subfamily)
VARADTGRIVQLVLDHLPPRYSRALEWKYLEDVSVDDIARRLQCTPKAAESLLTRARDAFRDAFAAVEAAANEVTS